MQSNDVREHRPFLRLFVDHMRCGVSACCC